MFAWYVSVRVEGFSLFFAIFGNGHVAIDWLHFYEFNYEKSANFAACARGAHATKFSFSKNKK